MIESFINSCDKEITHEFLKTLDRMLNHPAEIRAFLVDQEIQCKKDARDIKKFFSRIYKSNSRQDANRDSPHIFEAITPIYLEVSNWDTCLYLLRCKFKVRFWFHFFLSLNNKLAFSPHYRTTTKLL